MFLVKIWPTEDIMHLFAGFYTYFDEMQTIEDDSEDSETVEWKRARSSSIECPSSRTKNTKQRNPHPKRMFSLYSFFLVESIIIKMKTDAKREWTTEMKVNGYRIYAGLIRTFLGSFFCSKYVFVLISSSTKSNAVIFSTTTRLNST